MAPHKPLCPISPLGRLCALVRYLPLSGPIYSVWAPVKLVHPLVRTWPGSKIDGRRCALHLGESSAHAGTTKALGPER